MKAIVTYRVEVRNNNEWQAVMSSTQKRDSERFYNQKVVEVGKSKVRWWKHSVTDERLA